MSIDTVDLLEEMLAVPSPSGHEQALARRLADWAGRRGFRAHVDGVGNLVAEVGSGTGPRLMLLSHLDTAGSPLPVVRRDGVLRGRGAVDAKGPLATMLVAAAGLAEHTGSIVVIGAVQEEVASSAGARHVLATRNQPDALIVGEPNGWAGVGIGYRGRLGIEVEVSRPACHSAAPGEKAMEVAIEVWLAVAAWCEAQPGETAFTRPSAVVLRAEGGLERARMSIACRLPPGLDETPLRGLLSELRSRADLKITESTPGVRRDSRDPVVRALNAAIRDEGGRPRHTLKTGTCDLNVLAPHWPIPMAVYGPGDSKFDHTDDEQVTEEELHRATRVLRSACARLLVALDAGGEAL